MEIVNAIVSILCFIGSIVITLLVYFYQRRNEKAKDTKEKSDSQDK
jgi:heme/copper-type cytochrome/quinol oxidase subunit 2